MMRILLSLYFSLLCTVCSAAEKAAGIVVDGESGRILYASNSTAQRYPASLTKKMTLYLMFDALKKKRISLKTHFTVSERATRQQPSKIWLKPGQTVSVETLLKSMIVKSANDSAFVTAEGLGGSIENFAKMMTKKAHELGMHDTTFKNPSGLNDSNTTDKRQYTTAKDMSILAIALYRDFPEYVHYFKLKEFRYGGRIIKTHNRMLNPQNGIDGLKTGYAIAPGFNISTSAIRYNKHNKPYRLFVVVMGGKTARSRDQRAHELLDYGFQKLGFEQQYQPPVQSFTNFDHLLEDRAANTRRSMPTLQKVSAMQKKTDQKRYNVLSKNMVKSLNTLKKVGMLRQKNRFQKTR
jgi:D-alanyl-D-alanine carboxypeptidase